MDNENADYRKYAELAREGLLPKDFNQWELANKNGWTVAHMAARFSNLPPTFTQWELATKDGWTVAHTAAVENDLPKGFNQWELTDQQGHTVKQVYDSVQELRIKNDDLLSDS